ncbi:uncharacterized protein LOC135815358 [Sycon ciliatum]|uniref:uncharacterized protein LOC135815358 n=1 Tax=Sycon ciliatum TaxID=27933 RepID=UPI0031F70506
MDHRQLVLQPVTPLVHCNAPIRPVPPGDGSARAPTTHPGFSLISPEQVLVTSPPRVHTSSSPATTHPIAVANGWSPHQQRGLATTTTRLTDVPAGSQHSLSLAMSGNASVSGGGDGFPITGIRHTGSSSVGLSSFGTCFDREGRCVNEYELHKIIYIHGIESSARPVVWPCLLGVYTAEMTIDQRQKHLATLRTEYNQLVKQVERPQFSSGQDLAARIKDIEKDVPRTDRHVAFYAKEDGDELAALRRILASYAAYNPGLGYVQGMNDVAAVVQLVMRDEVLTFWCFVKVMERMGCTFVDLACGTLNELAMLMEHVDPQLHQHLTWLSGGNIWKFCLRWVLLGFKRELPMNDVIDLWERVWSRHTTVNLLVYIVAALLQQNRFTLMSHRSEEDLHQFAVHIGSRLHVKNLIQSGQALVLEFKPPSRHASGSEELPPSQEIALAPPRNGFVPRADSSAQQRHAQVKSALTLSDPATHYSNRTHASNTSAVAAPMLPGTQSPVSPVTSLASHAAMSDHGRLASMAGNSHNPLQSMPGNTPSPSTAVQFDLVTVPPESKPHSTTSSSHWLPGSGSAPVLVSPTYPRTVSTELNMPSQSLGVAASNAVSMQGSYTQAGGAHYAYTDTSGTAAPISEPGAAGSARDQHASIQITPGNNYSFGGPQQSTQYTSPPTNATDAYSPMLDGAKSQLSQRLLQGPSTTGLTELLEKIDLSGLSNMFYSKPGSSHGHSSSRAPGDMNFV